MTTLRLPHIVGLSTVSHARHDDRAVLPPTRPRSYIRIVYVKRRGRRDGAEEILQALRFGRDVLLALWAIAVLALVLIVLVGFVAR